MSISVPTNAQGQYTITIPAARVNGQAVTLRARAFGYTPGVKPLRVTPGAQTFDFSLAQDVNRLSTVVVTGVTAGTETKKLPFTVAQVNEKDMPVPGVSPLSQLQGKVPGVSIASTTGRPGAAQSVLLRGPQSINGQGRGQEPLYIVDGVVLSGGLPDINPLDIENVEVVKGAAASSLYGSRAGNGVIQITTKSGKNSGEGVRFSSRLEAGAGDIEREYHYARANALMLDETGQRFCYAGSNCSITVDLAEEARRVNEQGGDYALNPVNIERDFGIGRTPSKEMLRGLFQTNLWNTEYDPIAQAVTNGRFTNGTVDAQGRFGGTSFFASANALQQEGAIRFVPGYRRSAMRLNVDQSVGSDWSFGLRTYFSRSRANGEDHDNGGTGFFRLTRQPAGIDLLRRDQYGRLYVRSNVLNQGGQNQNPLYLWESYTSQRDRDRFLSNFNARYTPLSWLDFTADLSYDRGGYTYFFRRDKGYRTTSSDVANLGDIERGNGAMESYNTALNAAARHTFGDLQTRFNLRYSYEQQDSLGMDSYGQKLASPGLTTLEAISDPATIDFDNLTSSIRAIGMTAGLDLEYKERYIIGGLVRRDGSSLFGSANRWGTYGRGSVAWRVAEEPWWFVPQLNDVKLRASVGTAGNRPSFPAQYESFTIGAGGALSGNTAGNKNLRPETVTETEVGADLEAFHRLGLTVNYAHAISKDQILPVPPSASTGFNTVWRNAGTLENRTWEASLNIPVLQGRNFSYSTRINYDRNRAVVTALNVPEFFFGTDYQGTGSMFKVAVGERYGTFYGRQFVTSCSQLPAAYQSQCGGAGSQYQKNSDGYIVWTGGHGVGEGVTNNYWQSVLPACVNAAGQALAVTGGEVGCRSAGGTVNAPWANAAGWGMPMIMRDSTGNALQRALGNALPDFRMSMSHSLNYRRLSMYALFDGSFGREVYNEGRHWSLGDFTTAETDQLGKSIQDAKPIGYYWRSTDHPAGVGGFYDILGPNSASVEDASYVKLREVNLAYNFGAVRGVGDWTVNLIGRNLKTFTKYKGFDPEVGYSASSTTTNQSGSSQINALDAYNFPNTRTFTFAVSTRF